MNRMIQIHIKTIRADLLYYHMADYYSTDHFMMRVWVTVQHARYIESPAHIKFKCDTTSNHPDLKPQFE